MKSIILIAFFFFFVVNVRAQGNVVVHSDPRLSLLLKKNHPPIASSARLTHRAPTAISAPGQGMQATTIMPTPPPSVASSFVRPAESITAPRASEAPHASETPVHSSSAVSPPPPAPVAIRPEPPIEWAPKHHVRTIYSGKGFRVQIYRGMDRSRAMEIKNQFSRNNPGVRTYLTYIAPCFRVKVGDYRHRSDAEGMWREANSTYNPSMIVPDIITVTTIY